MMSIGFVTHATKFNITNVLKHEVLAILDVTMIGPWRLRLSSGLSI
jgi:hypothetical protein